MRRTSSSEANAELHPATSLMSELQRVSDALAPLYHLSRELELTTVGLAFQGMTSEGTSCRLMVFPRAVNASMTTPGGFTRDLERAGRFAHPGILPPLGAGVPDPEIAYYGFEEPSAPSTREVLRSNGAMGAREVARIGTSAAQILAGVHSAGLVHGLVTPDVVFVAGEGAVRIAGTGLYQALIAAGVPREVIAEQMGLEHYLSPEQSAGRPLDARTDVYLLGATLYELLTGRPPFGGRTTSTVMVSVLADEPTKTAPGGVRAPGKTVSAILRAIEKNPDDRWPTMEAFAHALQEPDVTVTMGKRRAGCLALGVFMVSGVGELLRRAGAFRLGDTA